MKVLKFGGTSVASAENLKRIKDILISDDEQKIVVCSAISGVTDQLIDIAQKIKNKDIEAIISGSKALENKHFAMIDILFEEECLRNEIKRKVSSIIIKILGWARESFSNEVNTKVITLGESLLTLIFSEYLNAIGIQNILLDAQEFMCLTASGYPDLDKVSKKLYKILSHKIPSNLYITQGFVCQDAQDQISHLGRGGSDYTATIIGAALDVDEIQIWTDIGGLHNNDPRYVSNTYPISFVNYKEASELAHFGAKILHPDTVVPVEKKNIPVRIKNTFEPNSFGTIISNKTYRKGLKAIAAKDNIILVKITPNQRLASHQYLKQIIEVFDTHNQPIDMLTNTHTEVILAIDQIQLRNAIIKELEVFSSVMIDRSNSIICIAGESISSDKNFAEIFDILKCIELKMISYGSSKSNVAIVVDTQNKVDALQYLNTKLFNQYAVKEAI